MVYFVKSNKRNRNEDYFLGEIKVLESLKLSDGVTHDEWVGIGRKSGDFARD